MCNGAFLLLIILKTAYVNNRFNNLYCKILIINILKQILLDLLDEIRPNLRNEE